MRTPNYSNTAKTSNVDPLSAIKLLSKHSNARLEDKQSQGIQLSNHGALTGLCTGHGTENLWITVAYALNMALILAEIGIQQEGLNIILDAQAAMMRIQAMARKNGEWKIGGTSAFIIKCAFKIHDEQLAVATINQLDSARREVRRRMEGGKSL